MSNISTGVNSTVGLSHLCRFGPPSGKKVHDGYAGSGKGDHHRQSFNTGTERHETLQKTTLSGNLVAELVGCIEGVRVDAILARRRGIKSISRARQLVMYLMHTSFGFSYAAIGEWMGKDRTTIAHACSVIEDMRDNLEFDRKLERLELVLAKSAELADA